VIGGAASGKSAFAEGLLRRSGLEKVYIATARALDAEMGEKIDRHRRARAADGWRTIEAPRDLTAALSGLGPGQGALIDCVTLWLSNLMLADRDCDAAVEALERGLSDLPAPVVLVSNEVGHGIVPETALGRAFRTLQGHANQRLARRADQVVQVTAGLPRILKAPPSGAVGP